MKFYANPYDMPGFFFEGYKEYTQKQKELRNRFGDPVEEFGIDFIEGNEIDSELFQALEINQSNLEEFMDEVESWNEDDKLKIIFWRKWGGAFHIGLDHPEQLDVQYYVDMDWEEVAMELLDSGFYGEIPDHLERFIGYMADGIAYELECGEWSKTKIGDSNYIWRVE